MNQEKIGNIIKKIRKDHNLTQGELAEKFGVTYQAVSKWENGKNLPDIEILKQICQEYKIDINELLDNKIEIKKNKKKLIFGIVILCLLVIGGIVLYLNKDSFEMRKIKTNSSDFSVTGSVAYDNKGKMYIYISDIEYHNKEDNTDYKSIKATLYEEYDNKNIKIKESDKVEKNISIKEYLKDISFNIDDYKSSCTGLSKAKLYIEIETINDSETVVVHKVPLELEELCPEKNK